MYSTLLTSKTITPACIVHVNIRSLKKNLDKLVNFSSDMKKSPEIIAVSETKINNKPRSFKQKSVDIILYMLILTKKLVVLEYI